MSEAQDLRGHTVIVTGASSASALLPPVPCTPPTLSRHGRIDGLVSNAGVSRCERSQPALNG